MSNIKLSRRDFLRISAITAAGIVTARTSETSVFASAPRQETITLDVMTLPEYEGPYREIWNIYQSVEPSVKINVFSVNEDTAAAHEAKVAGGYLPAIELTQELQLYFDKSNYEMAVNLSEINFDWWDRWEYDAKNAWSDLHNLPGPRALDCLQGIIFTWQYNKELMDAAGLDPQKDVKSWADLKKWLDEGTAWAAKTEGVDWFWNAAWHNLLFATVYMDMIPMAFPDGQRAQQADYWLGRKKFNDPDSPYRHVYEFFVEANQKGWIPPNVTTRLWEGDMEASYIAGKSVMMLHGPWVWDKALAAGSEFAVNNMQAGFPTTPPADGQAVWTQFALPPNIDNQWFMRAGVTKLPQWPKIEAAWNWFFSPDTVAWRAQAEGRVPLYKLDKPFELQGPQYQAVLKDIGAEGSPFASVQLDQGFTGNVLSTPFRIKGSKGVWDWQANGNNQTFADLLSGKITVQQALDIAQSNWEESYDMPTK